ncbi:MAG: hypothetical protein ACTSPD_10295 [Promethearchaeota archaeon]
MTKKKEELRPVNLFRPGTKEYYRDTLENIIGMTIDYDGYRSKKGLKSLIDDIRRHAIKALTHKTLYLGTANTAKIIQKEKAIICPNCERKIPNPQHRTKRGCIWCDAKYRRK